MATTPERSKPLHNFSLPYLKWGSQKFLKCMKISSSSSSSPPPQHQSKSYQFRSRPIKEESKKLKFSIPEEDESASAAARPWNLRTRRAACKAPKEDGKVEIGFEKEKETEKERTLLSVSLSKEEMEEDFAVMIGNRPPRRPKKRPRVVQKQLDSLFPGLWLVDITLDSYKVADVPEA